MKIVRHILIIILVLALIIGLPVYSTGYVQAKIFRQEAISSASVIIDSPSGAYVVVINKDLHKGGQTLDTWRDFFEGKEIDYLFEDISCVVADSDSVGLDQAISFMSRLPENQMSVHTIDSTLMMSKLKYGKVDVAIMSEEFCNAYGGIDAIDHEGYVIIEGEKL